MASLLHLSEKHNAPALQIGHAGCFLIPATEHAEEHFRNPLSMNRGLALLVAAVVVSGREAQEQAELGQGEWEEEWEGLRWGHMAAAMSGLIPPRAGCKLLSNRQAMRSTPQYQICPMCHNRSAHDAMQPVDQACGQAAGTIICSMDIWIAVS